MRRYGLLLVVTVGCLVAADGPGQGDPSGDQAKQETSARLELEQEISALSERVRRIELSIEKLEGRPNSAPIESAELVTQEGELSDPDVHQRYTIRYPVPFLSLPNLEYTGGRLERLVESKDCFAFNFERTTAQSLKWKARGLVANRYVPTASKRGSVLK